MLIKKFQNIMLNIKDWIIFRCFWYGFILFILFLGILLNDGQEISFVYNNF